MGIELKKTSDDCIESNDGWQVSVLGRDWIEYRTDRATCVVNVRYAPHQRQGQVMASESASEWFPHLREHLSAALHLMRGRFVLV